MKTTSTVKVAKVYVIRGDGPVENTSIRDDHFQYKIHHLKSVNLGDSRVAFETIRNDPSISPSSPLSSSKRSIYHYKTQTLTDLAFDAAVVCM